MYIVLRIITRKANKLAESLDEISSADVSLEFD